MLLHQFPDINMVRQLRNDSYTGSNVWRNVALNVRCKQVSRTSVESPYSIFLNKKGFSYCRVNNTQYRVETDAFLLTQPGEIYDLTIDNLDGTQTCNIHINRDFFNTWASTLTSSSEQLLDDPYRIVNAVPLLNTRFHHADQTFLLLASKLTSLKIDDSTAFEAILDDLVQHILLGNEEIQSRIAKLPFVKASVRHDLYKRLSLACDYMHSNYAGSVDIGTICSEIGMSTFHFLRTFKTFYGLTPHQYLSKLRMEKAASLLATSDLAIAEISDRVGFEYSNSFMKLFRNTYNSSPLQYRKQNSNFG